MSALRESAGSAASRREFPVFEETGSPLYYSNDARLHVYKEPTPGSYKEDGSLVALPAYRYRIVLVDDGELDEGTETGFAEQTVFTSADRVKADAYIAGYDLAVRS